MSERELRQAFERVARLEDENRALRARLAGDEAKPRRAYGRLVPFGLLGSFAITVVFVGSWLCPEEQRDQPNVVESPVVTDPPTVVQAAPTADSQCELPFYVDPQGIRHPKLECFRR